MERSTTLSSSLFIPVSRFDVGHELSVVGEVGDDFEDGFGWLWEVSDGGQFAGAGGWVILGADDEVAGAIGFLPVFAGGGGVDGEYRGGEEGEEGKRRRVWGMEWGECFAEKRGAEKGKRGNGEGGFDWQRS